MSPVAGERLRFDRWRLVIPESAHDRLAGVRDQLLDSVMAALAGESAAPLRRSRHATTWRVPAPAALDTGAAVFVKQLDPARGLIERVKAKLREKRFEHVLRISEDLRRSGFGVPRILLAGENIYTGHQLIVTDQVAGVMLTRWMNPARGASLAARRAILRKLGEEIARLHLSGYIHGDLTPYNVFATIDEQVSITFIDHERTRKTSRLSINLARERMRNLVQLAHLDIAGLSQTDKIRLLNHYTAAMHHAGEAGRSMRRRLIRMIRRRRRRDRQIERRDAQPAIIAEQGRAGG